MTAPLLPDPSLAGIEETVRALVQVLQTQLDAVPSVDLPIRDGQGREIVGRSGLRVYDAATGAAIITPEKVAIDTQHIADAAVTLRQLDDGQVVTANKVVAGDTVTMSLLAGEVEALVAEFDNLRVNDANIRELTVGKLSGGTMTAREFYVGSTRFQLDGQDERLTIRDPNGVTRVAVGKIGTSYGIVLRDAAGRVFLDERGVQSVDGGALSGAVDGRFVDLRHLDAGNITTGSIDAADIAVFNLDAGNITAGTLDAGQVNVINLNADSITTGSISTRNIRADSSYQGLQAVLFEDHLFAEDRAVGVRRNGNVTAFIDDNGLMQCSHVFAYDPDSPNSFAGSCIFEGKAFFNEKAYVREGLFASWRRILEENFGNLLVNGAGDFGDVRIVGPVLVNGELSADELSGPVKNFDIPHPDPVKTDRRLRHTSLESPVPETLVCLRATVPKAGVPVAVALPDWWRHLNGDAQVWVAPAGLHLSRCAGRVSADKAHVQVIAEAPGDYEVMVKGRRIDPAAVASLARRPVEYTPSGGEG